MLMAFLLIAAVAFIIYAIVSQYSKTPIEESVPKRVWGSLVAAAGALGALIATWMHSGGGTTP